MTFFFHNNSPTEKRQSRQVNSGPTQVETRVLLSGAANGPFANSQTFRLHSNPGATRIIYLDFNGHTTRNTQWNTNYNKTTITNRAYSTDADRSTFSQADHDQIQRIWQRVAEDFRPFNIDVTTQDPGTAALTRSGSSDTTWGIRVVIGTNEDGIGSGGGIAFINSFSWASDTPAYVYNTGEQAAADTASHEAGHALGLRHDGIPGDEYYNGHGSGNNSWNSIMGGFPSRALVQWSKGEYNNASNTEDDLAIITTSAGGRDHGVRYRSDDISNSRTSARALTVNGNNVSGSGIIERNTDYDWFSFRTSGGTINLTVNPFERGPNLDVSVSLYNSSGSLIATYTRAGQLNAIISRTLSAGTYYLRVTGVGEGNVNTTGYSDYGSLGAYTITGTVPNTTTTDDHSNTYVGATSIHYVGRTATGNLDQNGDADWFQLRVYAGQSYTFDVLLTSLRDSYLRLYASNGTTLITQNDDGGDGLASRITWTATYTGRVYLSVRAYADSYSGTYRLRATPTNNELNLRGTGGNDSVLVSYNQATNTYSTNFNGYLIYFDGVVNNVNYNAGGGTDLVRFYGGTASNVARFYQSAVRVTASNVTFYASNIENKYVYGQGGYDTAYFYGSAGNDVFRGYYNFARMTGSGYLNYAAGYNRTQATAGGGRDWAYLYGSTRGDNFYGYNRNARMTSTGYDNRAATFETVVAYGAGNGYDKAYFSGTSGTDRYYGYSTWARMLGTGYYNIARNFNFTQGTGAQNDRAYFYGGNGGDRFYGYHNYARMQGSGFYNLARNFGYNYANGGNGTDTAYLYDGAGNDRFVGGPNAAQLYGTGFRNFVTNFSRVLAYGTRGGTNTRSYGSTNYLLNFYGTWV